MSNAIDTRIVEMQFENGKFERDIESTIGLLQELDNNLEFKNATKGFENIAAAANNVSLQGISDSLEFIQGKFTTFGKWLTKKKESIIGEVESALKRVGNMFTLEPIQSGWEEYNTKTKATQTLLNNVSRYGSTIDDVTEVLDKLNTYADKTTYSFGGMIQTLSNASTAGLTLDELYDYTVGLSNLAAYSGVDNTNLMRAGYQINQALNKGYFEAVDWRSVMNAGLDTNQFRDVLKQVAAEGGLNVDELIANSSEGTIQNSMTEFKWLTKDLFLEALNRYGDATTELGQAAFESATKTKTFDEAIGQVTESLGSGWTKTFDLVIGNVEQAKEFWTPLTNSILEFTDAMSDSRNAMLASFSSKGGTKILLEIMLTLLNDIKTVINAITISWSKHFKKLSGMKLVKLFREIKKFVDKTLTPTEETLIVIDNIVGFIAESVKIVGTMLKGAFKIIKPLVGIVWNLATNIIFAISQFSGFLSYGMETSDWATTFLATCDTIAGVIAGIPGALQEFVDKVVDGYETVRGIVKDKTGFDISQPFVDAYNAVIDFVNTVQTKLADGTLWESVQKALAPIGNFFAGLFGSDEEGNNDIAQGIGDTIASVVTKFKELKSTLETTGIPGLFTKLSEDLDDPIGKLTKKFDKLLGGENGEGGLISFNDIFTNLGTIWDKFKEEFSRVWTEMQPMLDDIKTKVQPIVDPIMTVVNTCIEALTKTLNNIAQNGLTANEIASLGMFGALMYMSDQLGEIAESFKSIGDSFKDGMKILISPMSKFINALVDTITAHNKELKSETFKGYAIGIAAIIGAVVALTYINLEGITPAIVAVSGAVAMIGVIVSSVAKMTVDLEAANIAMFALFVNQLGAAVLKIALGMAAMVYVADSADSIEAAGAAIVGILTSLYLIYKLISDLGKPQKLKKDESLGFISGMPLQGFASLVKSLGAAILMMAGAMWILVDAYNKNWQAFAISFSIIQTFFTEMMSLIMIFDAIDSKKIIALTSTGALSILGLALIEIAAAIDILILGIIGIVVFAGQNMAALWSAAFIVGALVAAVGAFLWEINCLDITPDVAMSLFLIADSLVIMAAAIDVLLAGLIVLAIAAKDMDKKSIDFTILITGWCALLIIAIVGVVGLLSTLGPEVALGMMTAAFAMVGAAVAIDVMILGMIALIEAVKDVPTTDIDKIWTPIFAMLVVMLVMSILSLIFMGGGIGGAAGILATAAAVWIFAQAINALLPAIQQLGSMDQGQLAQGLLSVVGLVAVIIVVLFILSSLSGGLAVLSLAAIGFGVAIFLVAAAFAAFSVGLLAFAAAGTTAAPVVATVAAAFGSGLMDGITTGILQFIKRLPEIIHTCGDSFIKALDELQTLIINFMVFNISSTVTGLIKVVIAFAQVASPLIAKLIEVLIDLLTQLLAGINNGLEQNKHELAYYIGNIIAILLEIVLEALYVCIIKLGEWAVQMLPIIYEDIKNLGKQIGDFIIKVLNDFVKEVSTFASNFLNAIFPTTDDVASKLDGILDIIKNTLGIDLKAIVKGAINGVGSVASGIANAAGSVANAAAGLFNGITGAGKETLDINSPSKVMQNDIVRDGIIGGLLSGFNLYGESATNAMSTLGEDLTSSFDKSIGSINLDQLYSDSLNPTITPVVDLSNVETSFSDISKMSDSINFDFSAITGQSFNKKLNSDQQRAAHQESLLNDIIKGFEDQSASESALADAILNANQDTKIYLDKDILIGATYRDYDSKLGKVATLQRRQ